MNVILRNAWIIPVIPLGVSAVLALLGRRLKEPIAGWLAFLSIAACFVLTCICFAGIVSLPGSQREVANTVYSWIPAGGFDVSVATLVDPLSVVWMLLITGVGSLIFLYAIAYIHGDRLDTQFFSYMTLFVGSMLILVMGSNYLVMFVGWELVGACSYLLIGFWFAVDENATAAKKAFITNRVGDFFFFIGLMLIFLTVGSLDYSKVLGIAGLPGASAVNPATLFSVGMATAVCLLLLAGATGKSAQLPVLYVWLPDAMAGPTPVSALIHAATMVTAGVYMIARSSALFDLAPAARFITALIGICTALYAGLIAMGQWRMKRVLAYSTVSQIGYMVAGVGIGGYGIAAGVFHVIIHGFFKALLFLGAGSVMHAMDNEEDMRHLGGLRKVMPITWLTFWVGVLSISGFFPFAGFFSKDGILGALYEAGPLYGKVFWLVGLVAALITGLYMTRLVLKSFHGEPHWKEGAHPHESGWKMTVPLLVLAVGATFGGLLDLPDVSTLSKFIEPVVAPKAPIEPLTGTGWLLLVVGAIVGISGVVIGYIVFGRLAAERRARIAANLGGLMTAIRNKFWVDEALQATVERPGYQLVKAVDTVDQKGIDRGLVGLGLGVRGGGRFLRKSETGYVREYAAVILAGVVVVVAYILLRGGLGL